MKDWKKEIVEQEGGLTHRPLVKPDEQISRIRLSLRQFPFPGVSCYFISLANWERAVSKLTIETSPACANTLLGIRQFDSMEHFSLT